MRDAFVGIDVAFAKHKRLPICICVRQDGRLTPLPLRDNSLRPPIGGGYRRIIEPEIVEDFARRARDYIEVVARVEDLNIKAIAIDASSRPKPDDEHRRACEAALDAKGIRYFVTPSRREFQRIVKKVRAHFASGGPSNKIPHANQLWMLAGFALFDALRPRYPCLEVFPQAVIRQLLQHAPSKLDRAGLDDQLAAVAAATYWSPAALGSALRNACYGVMHDRLDAYIAAWVASLSPSEQQACGHGEDVIWLPKRTKI